MKCENYKEEIKEKKEKVISIKNRFNNNIIYESKTSTTIKECLIEAIKKGINLSESDLSWSDLSESNLSGSDLSGSDLSWSDLSESNLSGSDLSGSDLRYCKMTKDVFKQITENWFKWEIGK